MPNFDRPARVLIVDDERHNRQVLEIMLKPEGYEIKTAASGTEALAMILQEPPDLILVDIMMPEMDGYRVTETIKGDPTTRNIPLIMVSALDNREARLCALTAGAEDFLAKPVDRAEMCVRVRNLLRLKAYGEHFDKYSQNLEAEVASRTADLVERTTVLEAQAAVLTEQAALLDLAPDAIIVRDMHSRVLFWSRGAERMYGWSAAEAIGANTSDLLHVEISPATAQVEEALLSKGQWDGEETHHRRDGTRLAVASRWALQRDADGVPQRILTINNDISSRKQDETELRLLTERLALATSVAKVGVWELDLATQMLTCDATMFAMHGIAPAVPMSYEAWAAVLLPLELAAVEATWRSVVELKGEGAIEYHLTMPDGAVKTIASAGRAVLDEGGNAIRLIGVNLDVTERRETERILEAARVDQLRFKDEFVSHVSHELRSPLTAIKQFTSILATGIAGGLNPEQQQYQEIVLRNVAQLQKMIDDLLEITRLETGKLTINTGCVFVPEAVSDAFHTLEHTARAKGVSLSCDLAADLPTANADGTRLRQILIILLDNAIKFTPAGGAVSVSVRRSETDPGFLCFDVSDTGCGIEPDMATRLFERLYQAVQPMTHAGARKGLGLGLFICKELVTRQGGQIWARRQADQGSIFSFTVPFFSLETSIAPLLKTDRWPARSLALVEVDCRPGAAWPTREARDEYSREVRSLLERCVLPDVDVLLPKMCADAQEAPYVIAAFANEKGAAVLTERIRDQFERHGRLKQRGLSVAVSYRMLTPEPDAASATPAETVAKMAKYLEKLVKIAPVTEEVES